jgi:hypothetical protein
MTTTPEIAPVTITMFIGSPLNQVTSSSSVRRRV